MLKNFKNRCIQQGFNLLETMLVLAIISVLLIMSTRYYKSADQGQKISNSISLISGIAGGAAQYLSANPGEKLEAGTSLTKLTTDHYLPDNFKAITSPWGQRITVEGSGGLVTVTMPGVPGAPCRILKTSLTGTDNTTCGTGDGVGTVVVTY